MVYNKYYYFSRYLEGMYYLLTELSRVVIFGTSLSLSLFIAHREG
jgi:hypothetical protein